MISNKQAKALGMNRTIDLKYMMYRDYCDEIEGKGIKNKTLNLVYPILVIIGVLTVVYLWSTMMINITLAKEPTSEKNNIYAYYGVDNFTDYQRSLRLEAYERMQLEILGINEKDKNIHCTTMMTLVTAYESAGMTSNMCATTNNCLGLKGVNENGDMDF